MVGFLFGTGGEVNGEVVGEMTSQGYLYIYVRIGSYVYTQYLVSAGAGSHVWEDVDFKAGHAVLPTF